MKKCNKCLEEKHESEFGKGKLSKGGIRATCKKCNAQYSAQYRKLNPEKVIAQSISWRDKNPGASAEISKAWREANPGAQKESTRKYLINNKEKAAGFKRSWRLKNKDACRAHQRKRRALQIGAEGSHTAQDVDIIFGKQRGCCANCNGALTVEGPEKYHVDHITPLTRGGSNWPENLQCLCPSCNKRKHAKDPFEWAKENWKLL